MRSIRISDEVWGAIAKRGKFGETEDDVLRRILEVPPAPTPAIPSTPESVAVPADFHPAERSRSGTRFATIRMSSYVRGNILTVEFHGGKRQSWPLPGREDKRRIRAVRDLAVQFAREQGASYGQEMAVKKALTEAGYHLMK